MQFPHCDHDRQNLIDTQEKGETIRRHRQCLDYKWCFTTYEHVAIGIGSILSGSGWLFCSNEKATPHHSGGLFHESGNRSDVRNHLTAVRPQ